MYIYLDREQAKKGIALVIGAFEKQKKDFITYFEGEAIEFVGDNIPYYITYVPELDTVREATEEEKLERNQKKLDDNEILIDGKIISYDIYSEKIENGQIVKKSREDYIVEGIISLESEQNKARYEREKQFNALDLYDKAVLRGDLEENAEEKIQRDNFRNTWLEIPNNYTDLNIPIENLYPDIPNKIKYFL